MNVEDILNQAKIVDSRIKRGVAYHIIKSEYNNWETWGRFHDSVLESIGLDLSINQCVTLFHYLPKHIQNLAFEYGFNDTVFGDDVFEYCKDNKDSITGWVGYK